MRYEWECKNWPEYKIVVTRRIEDRMIPPTEEELVGAGLKPEVEYVRVFSPPVNRWYYCD